MAEVAIDVQRLYKSFGGLEAVKGVDLQIDQGEIFGFVGPNGSGKTTTIRMLCGLLTPDAGSGTCMGYDLLTQAYEIKSMLGYMTQQFSLYHDLSVYENLKFTASLYNISHKRQRIQSMMERFELAARQNQLAGTLSGGWKQRLALAVALLHEPKLLLLDEPTSGVDLQARREFWSNIENITADGVTALVSTHYMDEVIRCHRLAYIAYGQILATGRAHELTQSSTLEAYFLVGSHWRQVFQRLKQHFANWQLAPRKEGVEVVLMPGQNLPEVEDYDLSWRKIQLSFEDYFVGLMQQTGAHE
jgi:ABC-2 type transport system ATP-binding protein